MSAVPEDIPERIGRIARIVDADEVRAHRLVLMLRELEAGIKAMIESNPMWATLTAWEPFFEELEAFGEITSESVIDRFDELEHLAKLGYRLTLISADVHTHHAAEQLPRTPKDWEALPDAVTELENRLRRVGS